MNIGKSAAIAGQHAPSLPLAPPRAARAPSGAAGGTGARSSFVDVLREGGRARPAGRTPTSTPASASAPPSAAAPKSGLRRVMQSALRAEDSIDGILKAAASGKTFSAGELLAMQSTVFRYSQTVEVISRAADRLVGAVKQTLGTQV